MWELNEINVGDVKVGERKKAVFVYNGTKEVVRVIPGCGCTSTVLKDNELTVVIKIKEFPKHLKHQQSINIKKNMVIYYKGISKPEVLYIAGKLIQT